MSKKQKTSNELWFEARAAEDAWRLHYNRLKTEPQFDTVVERRKNHGLWMRWKNREKKFIAVEKAESIKAGWRL